MLRVDEEPQKQGNTRQPRESEAARCGQGQGTQKIIPSSCTMPPCDIPLALKCGGFLGPQRDHGPGCAAGAMVAKLQAVGPGQCPGIYA